LKGCSFPGHSDWLLDQGDDEANRLAYAIATNRWENGEIDGEREEFLDAVRHVIKSAPYDCPRRWDDGKGLMRGTFGYAAFNRNLERAGILLRQNMNPRWC
jgi:hypothetical protein